MLVTHGPGRQGLWEEVAAMAGGRTSKTVLSDRKIGNGETWMTSVSGFSLTRASCPKRRLCKRHTRHNAGDQQLVSRWSPEDNRPGRCRTMQGDRCDATG